MRPVDDLLLRLRDRLDGAEPEDIFKMRARSLQALVSEIDTLRAALAVPDDNQLGLLHAGAKQTEVAAALLNLPRSGNQRRRILEAIWRSGADGMTDMELSKKTGIKPSSERPRRVELVQGGWIRDSLRTRPSEDGAEATVWLATSKTDIALRREIQ